MVVASFVIACLAFLAAGISVAWQIFTWWHARRSNVSVRIDSPWVRVGAGTYDVTVVVENHGSQDEAVQLVVLLYDEGMPKEEDGLPPAKWHVRAEVDDVVRPRQNFRRTFDLLAGRFGPPPTTVTAVVTLQSGRTIRSEPYVTDETSMAIALAGLQERHAGTESD